MWGDRVLAFTGIILLGLTSACSGPVQPRSSWTPQVDRYWVGPDYWANSLQDWRVREGRIECIGGRKPIRTLHLLTRTVGERSGDLQMRIRTGVIEPALELEGDAWRGFLVGFGSGEVDYRAGAIIHRSVGENGGLAAVVTGSGNLALLDSERELQEVPVKRTGSALSEEELLDLALNLQIRPSGGEGSEVVLEAVNAGGELLQKIEAELEDSRLAGHVAIVSNGGRREGATFWFRDWELTGSKLDFHQERRYGPILAALHTLSGGILKLTAQLPPVGESDSQVVRLEIEGDQPGTWQEVARENIIVPGWTAHFRIPGWDASRDHTYRLAYSFEDDRGVPEEFYYTGEIRRDPTDKATILLAAFTGNSNSHGTFGDRFIFSTKRIWFPHADIVRSVSYHDPDLLVFTGDQVYEGRPTEADRSGEWSSYLDYLYKWYLWCWAYQELTRSIPVVCLPDDHDVYHGNIWGAGGRAAREIPPNESYPDYYRGLEGHWRQDGGGYLMPPEFVRMVERTQTAHLPDPFDPTPVEQGIGVYYTSMTYGRISFAILEDRKFKSAPAVLIPEAKVVNGFSQVPGFPSSRLDVPDAKLLGERQIEFLREWASDWRGADMKASLSQTLLANLSTYPEEFKTDAGTPDLESVPFGVIPAAYELARDMDSNGWPQSGRNRALAELRRGFAFMVSGDQHLGSIVHHGIDDWEDAGYSFCVPSIANLWPRRWYPSHPGENHQEGMPAYTGRYRDGFGNRMTVWAVSNPVISHHEPPELHDAAPGYGIIRFHKPDQTITMECWPRYANPWDGDAVQYPGWPRTVSMRENYGRSAEAYLPELRFEGTSGPVVQIIDERDGSILYTLRVRTSTFTPWVFRPGLYTIRLSDPDTGQSRDWPHVRTEESPGAARIEATFH